MYDRTTRRLVRLRPRDDTLYVSQNRTVFASGRDGQLTGGADHGLWPPLLRDRGKSSEDAPAVVAIGR